MRSHLHLFPRPPLYTRPLEKPRLDLGQTSCAGSPSRASWADSWWGQSTPRVLAPTPMPSSSRRFCRSLLPHLHLCEATGHPKGQDDLLGPC